MFEKTQIEKIKENLTKKYGEKDAKTILDTAETRAKIELQTKPEIPTEKPKIDYNKFVKKEVPKISKELQPLIQEARKYKSAEEFVKAQGNKVYRGGEAGFAPSQRGAFKDSGFSVARDIKTAKEYGKVSEGFISTNAKIKQLGRVMEDIDSKIATAKKEGFDAIEFSSYDRTAKETKEILVLNPDIVKTKSQLTDIWEKAQGIKKVKPIEYKPIEEARIEPTGVKEAGIARSIEAKAIERGLLKEGAVDLSTFEGTTIKEQARAVEEMIKSDFDRTRAVIRGEEALPEGVRGISVIKGMEEVIDKAFKRKNINEAAELARELANSKLAAKVSEAAQELSLARGRELDSASAKMRQIKKAREAKAEKDLGKKKDIKEQIKKETKKVNLSKEDLSWERFIQNISC